MPLVRSAADSSSGLRAGVPPSVAARTDEAVGAPHERW